MAFQSEKKRTSFKKLENLKGIQRNKQKKQDSLFALLTCSRLLGIITAVCLQNIVFI